nr:2OG-Fe(II) oxygenase [Roseibium aggregatum]
MGSAVLSGILTPPECRAVTALYDQGTGFRSHIRMQRHGFGKGEYKYFAYPLPPLVQALREMIYPLLVPTANAWQEHMGLETQFPVAHKDYLELCAKAGQTKPTPLLLRYGPGDYNCLHQDVYGEMLFPLQAAVLLSDPETDFSGGEFVLTEQRPRMQSRAEVVSLQQGDAVVFSVRNRPARGTRGFYRVNMRHGVSRVREGSRHTLGVIFHDAA